MKSLKDKHIVLGIACILAYMLPYLILGENAYVTIHDFLDQNVVIMANLKNNGLLTSLNGIVPNMDGLNRSLFPYFSPFDVKMVCYALLPTYWAIITYTFVYKIVAFFGLYLLLNTYVFQKKNKWITFLLSLGFAFVPFYVELAISGAGFPLMIYAFLNLYHNKNKAWSLVAIIFYSFNSMLAYGGFFFLVVLFCCMFLDYCHTKKLSKDVVAGVAIMCFVYLLANWGTIFSLFFSDSFVSHRSEWIHSKTLLEDMKSIVRLLLLSQYHAGTCIVAPILLLFVLVFIRYKKAYPILTKMAVLYGIIVLGILAGTLLKQSNVQIFTTIQFDRFYFFYPSIVYLLLASSCLVIVNEISERWAICPVIFGLLCGACCDKEQFMNFKLIAGKTIEVPTFKQFYDTTLFDEIHKQISTQPNYKTKTISVGIYPCVAEYNGFWTLDAYRVNYPVEYKHKFRTLIAPELNKSESLRKSFDEWGSRCYVFSAMLEKQGNQYLCGKKDKISIDKLEIDTVTLKDLDCDYVISAVNILNYQALGLDYVDSFTTHQSYWSIKVYKVK